MGLTNEFLAIPLGPGLFGNGIIGGISRGAAVTLRERTPSRENYPPKAATIFESVYQEQIPWGILVHLPLE